MFAARRLTSPYPTTSPHLTPTHRQRCRELAAQPRLLVNRQALLANLRRLRSIASGTRVCAIIKADAYGHGAPAIADALLNSFSTDLPTPAVDALAVATFAEAAELPAFDVPTMILRPVELVYLGSTRNELDEALRRGCWLSLVSAAAADDVARAAERLEVRANVQVMLDTGMNREMCDPRRFADVIDAVLRRPALRLVAVGTHYTDGELSDEPYNDEQNHLFHVGVDSLADRLPKNIIRHAANSGGVFAMAEEHHEEHDEGEPDFDMIRCGLSLYGVHPSVQHVAHCGLRPVAKWVAPLLLVRDVHAGESVGYNRTWRATTDTRVGLVPVGYADGYPRRLSGNAVVRLPGPSGTDDAICPVIGRVNMDYLTIDLSKAAWAQAGDMAVLLDDDSASPCSAVALARQCETIPYEIFCNIGRRIQRVIV